MTEYPSFLLSRNSINNTRTSGMPNVISGKVNKSKMAVSVPVARNMVGKYMSLFLSGVRQTAITASNIIIVTNEYWMDAGMINILVKIMAITKAMEYFKPNFLYMNMHASTNVTMIIITE